MDPAIHLKRAFHEKCDEVVLLRDIDFFSLCEHHLLPFQGRAHVAYLSEGKVVGLSFRGLPLDTSGSTVVPSWSEAAVIAAVRSVRGRSVNHGSLR